MIRLEVESESIVLTLDEQAGNGGHDVAVQVDETDRRIEQTIAYMRQHLDQPIKAAVLAAQANLSLSHYFALFKRRTGCAPIDFFTRLRMRRACRLLETTCLNVKQVAAVLGYDDQFYFSRVFKSVYQISPSEYRTLPAEVKDQFRSRALTSWRDGSRGVANGENGACWGAPRAGAARHK